jgi:polysaccharide export outer membrane protein
MCAVGVGCQSLEGPGAGGGSAPGMLGRAGEAGAPSTGVIAPQTFVYWSIQATDGLPNKLMTGQSLVSPEGKMELGPYGSVRVAGMNAEQARSAVERQLSRYLKNPKVTLSLDAPAARVADQKPSGSSETPPTPLASKVVAVGWQRGQMADEAAPVPPSSLPRRGEGGAGAPAEGPTIEIPALTPPPMNTPNKVNGSSGKDSASNPAAVNSKSLAPSPPRPLPSSQEAPATTADQPPSEKERVSQWRPMLRRTETTSVPLVPPGLEGDLPSRSLSSSPPRPLILRAVAQEKPGSPSVPRQMPKANDTPKSEVITAPPPREVIENGPPVAYGPGAAGVVGAPIGAPVPREGAKVSLPPYVIEPPDILLIESTQKIPDQPVRGQHLVRPDGTVSLGIYGSAYVAGMTIDQAKESIGRTLATRIKDFDLRNLNVDILAYNSKFFYVITDGAGYGEQVIRMPITGSETVLDGISQIFGLPAVSSKQRIWIARRSPDGTTDQVLPVDWCGVAQRGSTSTNYQIMPGDRIYVDSKRWVRFDTGLARFLSPFERVLGITLLGSETVNSISGRTTGTGGIP